MRCTNNDNATCTRPPCQRAVVPPQNSWRCAPCTEPCFSPAQEAHARKERFYERQVLHLQMGAHDENASCLRSGLCPGRALPATSLRPQGTPSTLKHSRARPAGERGAPRACCAISASLAACPGGWPRSRSDSSAAMRAPARRDTAASLLPGSPSSRMAASRRAHSRRSAASASPPASPAAPARPHDSLCHNRPRHHALKVLGSPSRAAAAACAARCLRAISCVAASRTG